MTDPGCTVQVTVRCKAHERLLLLAALTRLIDDHALGWPGFAGADILTSVDGTRLTATLAWRTRADWLAFGADAAVVATAAPIAATGPEVSEVELAYQTGPGLH